MATRLPNGKYRAQVYIGTDENGKRLYKSFVEETADEAEYAALTYKLGKGKRTDAKTVTLRAAMDAYIQSKEGVLAMSTIINYKRIVKRLDTMLDVPIKSINNRTFQTLISNFAKCKKMVNHNGRGEVSAKTVRNAYGLINATLRQNGVYINGVTVPQRKPIEYKTPFGDELSKIFQAVAGTNLEIPVLLAACCSLRRSEILGLTFGDLDREKCIATIRRAKVYAGKAVQTKTPKTETSARIVFVPSFLMEKLMSIPHSSDDEFVVPLAGNTVTYKFAEILKKHKIEHCRFHDLRHAFVSILAEQGVDEKYIQEMGGWSSGGVMNSIYKQTSIERKKDIAKIAEGIFNGIMQHNAT